MPSPTIGSLFSGVSGLDMALEQVFGSRTLWHCEVDPAATAVLARLELISLDEEDPRPPGQDGGEQLLLPTPVAQPSANSPEAHLRKKLGRKRVTDLSILVENDLLETGGALLPTPGASDGSGGRSPSSSGGTRPSGAKRSVPLTDVPHLLPDEPLTEAEWLGNSVGG